MQDVSGTKGEKEDEREKEESKKTHQCDS